MLVAFVFEINWRPLLGSSKATMVA